MRNFGSALSWVLEGAGWSFFFFLVRVGERKEGREECVLWDEEGEKMVFWGNGEGEGAG